MIPGYKYSVVLTRCTFYLYSTLYSSTGIQLYNLLVCACSRATVQETQKRGQLERCNNNTYIGIYSYLDTGRTSNIHFHHVREKCEI